MATFKVKGGDKFRQRMAVLADRLNRKEVLRVGFLEGATYPNGTPVAMIAAIHNYGAPAAGIPPRPFFSNMVRDRSDDWPVGIATQLKANDYDVAKTLAVTGEVIAGQLKQAIRDFSGVPLKPSTIKRKGFDKQLVDTGHMLNSVSYEIKT